MNKYLVLSLITLTLTGCATARPIEFHPIDKQDIFLMPKGSTVNIPVGSTLLNEKKEVTHTWSNEENIKVDRQGVFVSKTYVDSVMKVRLAENNE